MLDVKLKMRPGHQDGRDWMAPSPLRLLFWNVTYACNFRCPICFANACDPAPGELDTDEARRMLREVRAAGVTDMIISGGEPFMREDLPDLLAAMAKLGIGARIASNGSLLTRDLLQRLRDETSTTSFMINIDTLDPELYARTHGVPAHLLERALASARLVHAMGFHTTVSARVTPETIPGLPALLEHAAQEDWATVSLQTPLTAGRAEGGASLHVDWLRELEPVFEHFLSLPRHWRVETYIPWARYHPVIRRLAERVPVAHVGCAAGRSALVLHPAGWILPCLCLDIPQAYLGNIRTDRLADVFERAPFCRMTRSPKAHGICADCDELAACGGGCRANAFAHTGRLDGLDPSCPIRQAKTAEEAAAHVAK